MTDDEDAEIQERITREVCERAVRPMVEEGVEIDRLATAFIGIAKALAEQTDALGDLMEFACEALTSGAENRPGVAVAGAFDMVPVRRHNLPAMAGLPRGPADRGKHGAS